MFETPDANATAKIELAAEQSLAEVPLPPDPLPDNLNPRQKMFVAEYLKDSNATQAALRSGYSPNTAGQIGFALLRNAKIAAALSRGMAQRLERVNVTVERVLQEMTLLAESSIDHYVIDDFGNVKLAEGAPDGAMRAVQSIKRRTRVLDDGTREYVVELRLWDKPTPLRLMGKHVGLFQDKVEVVGPGGGPIQVAAARLADMTKEELAQLAENLAKSARELGP